MQSFYWFDFETFGASPSQDRPSQFAGIRTDTDLNILGEPLILYCKPPKDYVPAPQACLITGITPQEAIEKGVNEAEFIARIHQELSEPETCAVGYNSLRFDDEVLRNLYYRNLRDPYAREWMEGNSRWDILELARLCFALRPDGIEWPINDEGRYSLKLEHLSAANGLSHEKAHDAMSDVYATLGLAKLIKDKQPRLYDFYLSLRDKRKVADFVNLAQPAPFVHLSSMLGVERFYTGLLFPLMAHPTNKNAVLCYDLSAGLEDLTQLEAEDIHERMFTPSAELPQGMKRLPIKEVHLNKCPLVAPVNTLNAQVQTRIGLDLESILAQVEPLKDQLEDFLPKLEEVFIFREFAPKGDVDLQIYAGFVGRDDRFKLNQIIAQPWEAIARHQGDFEDARLPELLFRYVARNAPQALSVEQMKVWRKHCQDFLFNPFSGSGLIVEDCLAQIDALESADTATGRDWMILGALREYVQALAKEFEE
jgi:exodeoxyribonuclease-1